jgi:L-fuconolactonase
MIIDAHQHFWKYNASEYGWIDDRMAVLKNDFLPNKLKKHLETTRIDGTIAVQARQTIEETEWLLRLSDQFDFIKGVVGWVNLRDKKVKLQLERFSKHPKFVGVRHVLHDEEDDDFMLRPDFLCGIKLLAEFDLTYDILIFPKHLPNTLKFISYFPEQKFVIDHIAKPGIKNKIMDPWMNDMKRAAEFPNVYCKVSGVVTEADWQNWKATDFYPYLDVVFEAFGTERILFGSDWPVCILAGDYGSVFKIVFDYMKNFSANAREQIFGTTTEKFYGINKN